MHNVINFIQNLTHQRKNEMPLGDLFAKQTNKPKGDFILFLNYVSNPMGMGYNGNI